MPSTSHASQTQPLLPVHRREHSQEYPSEFEPSKTSIKVCLIVFVVMSLILPILSFISELSLKALSGRPPFAAAIQELHYRAHYQYAAVS